MFETFEEDGTHLIRGTVFVIAILDRDTLKLKGYMPSVFHSEEDADDCLFHLDEEKHLAYVVQEKAMQMELSRTEQ